MNEGVSAAIWQSLREMHPAYMNSILQRIPRYLVSPSQKGRFKRNPIWRTLPAAILHWPIPKLQASDYWRDGYNFIFQNDWR
jgi:hypothetical protein